MTTMWSATWLTQLIRPRASRPRCGSGLQSSFGCLDHVREDDPYAAWLLITTTGMRRGELAGLRWVDVDLEAARVSIRQPRVVVASAPRTSEPKTACGRRALALDP